MTKTGLLILVKIFYLAPLIKKVYYYYYVTSMIKFHTPYIACSITCVE